VDDADYEVWRAAFGSTSDLAADGNRNGRVDAGDYTIWRDNLGAVAPAAVPTPDTSAAAEAAFAEQQAWEPTQDSGEPPNNPMPTLLRVDDPRVQQVAFALWRLPAADVARRPEPRPAWPTVAGGATDTATEHEPSWEIPDVIMAEPLNWNSERIDSGGHVDGVAVSEVSETVDADQRLSVGLNIRR
ncbi:MAG: hypothetical protein AAF961_18785, partial [Planctomycetota bacterium]